MTPLLSLLRKELTRSPARRKFVDTVGLLPRLRQHAGEIAAFDVAGITPLIGEIARKGDDSWCEHLLRSHLIAPCMWLESAAMEAALVIFGPPMIPFRECQSVDMVAVNRQGAAGMARSRISRDCALAIIGLLNTQNTVLQTIDETRRLRAKRGRRDHLASHLPTRHKVVQFSIDGKVIEASALRSSTGNMPLHFVLGHTKTVHTRRGPEIRSILPYWRGSESNGVVTREYVATTERVAA